MIRKKSTNSIRSLGQYSEICVNSDQVHCLPLHVHAIESDRLSVLLRCIKPNDKKVAHIFTDSLVCHQVRYLGLMENVRVRRAGYAFRQPYESCLERYKMLCKKTWPQWRGPTR